MRNEITLAAFGAYVDCAIWSSVDDDGEPLDENYGPEDLSDSALAAMRRDVSDFLAWAEREGLGDVEGPEQFGHDFWLTRNGHGAGFWGRDLGDAGNRLTEMAHAYGESYLYVGDDSLIYIYGEEVAR